MKDNRREFIKNGAALAALSAVGMGYKGIVQNNLQTKIKWPPPEGSDSPKIILICPMNATPEYMRKLKQIGIDYVLMGGPPLPWNENGLRKIIDRFKAEGLTVLNMMLPVISNIICNREGRDMEIKQVQDSIRAAGLAGLPIVEYNFYAHRLMEGYYNVKGRGGAGYRGFDYNRTDSLYDNLNWAYPDKRKANETFAAAKDLLPFPEEGSHTYEQLWDNLDYFLKAVIPVAEKSNVRMSLHPNDPPVPISRGSKQIMSTFEDWKRLVNVIDSPSNGMTYDCGVSNEIGEDPLNVLDYLISRDRINHVHFRNTVVEIPRLKYVEVFPDTGTVNMYEVMKQLVQRKYKWGIYPEHPRVLDYDLEHPGGGEYTGFAYTVAYTRGVMQSVQSL